MNETVLGLLGLVFLYAVVHFIVIQFSRNWENRSGYERFITVFGIVVIALIFIDTMFS